MRKKLIKGQSFKQSLNVDIYKSKISTACCGANESVEFSDEYIEFLVKFATELK